MSSLTALWQRLKYRALYRLMHRRGAWVFDGHSLEPHAQRIGELIRTLGVTSALDYGCGKGRQYEEKRLHELHEWGFKPALYDPGVPGYATLPTQTFDAVICTDVLEHVHESLLPDVLSQIFARGRKLVYLAISTRLAEKRLPNGENAHCTVHDADWWMNTLSTHRSTQHVEVSFQGAKDAAPVVRIMNHV